MLCDDCKKRSATVFLKKIINNNVVEKHLCEDCKGSYSEISFGDFSLGIDNKFPIQDILKGLFGNSFGEGVAQQEAACPTCEMTYSDFSRGGKIGCSNCYNVFGDSLEPIIRRVHGACGHTGKAPARTASKLVIKQKIKQMRQELDRLVCKEEYEAAAKVRDQIRHYQEMLQD